MGRVSEFVCPSCHTSWEIQLGHGMGHAALENVLNEFPSDICQKVLSDTERERNPVFEFNYCPAVCWQCRKVVAVPVIYLHQSGQTYTAVCPDCGSSAAIHTEDAEILCPYCGKSTLTVEEVGRWD